MKKHNTKMKGKKVLSMLLALIMVLSVGSPAFPEMFGITAGAATANAGDAYATLFTASDLQSNDYPKTMKAIMNQINDDGVAERPDAFLFGGDFQTSGNPEESISHHLDVVEDIFNDFYPYYHSDNLVFIKGNHDLLDKRHYETGLHEFEDFVVYVINEDDYTAGSLSDAQTASANLQVALDRLLASGNDKPIFVMTHVPIHYNSRGGYGQSAYGRYLFKVLNDMGNYMDIVFMFGHNHSGTYDDYIGGSVNFLGVGDTIYISEYGYNGSTASGEGEYRAETLNFTYMNYGYAAYNNNTNGTVTHPITGESVTSTNATTMGVLEICPDKIVVSRYSPDGKYGASEEITRKTPANEDGSYDNAYVKVAGYGVGEKGTQFGAYANANGFGENATYTWSSSSPEIADIAVSNGPVAQVANLAEGTTTITVTVSDGNISKSASYELTVVSQTLSLPSAQIRMGLTEIQNQTLEYYNINFPNDVYLIGCYAGVDGAVTNQSWESDTTSVATVDDGLVTFVGNGTAKITYSFEYNGTTYSASTTFVVSNGAKQEFKFQQTNSMVNGKTYAIVLDYKAQSYFALNGTVSDQSGLNSAGDKKHIRYYPQGGAVAIEGETGSFSFDGCKEHIWIAEASDTANSFYLKNLSSGLYLNIGWAPQVDAVTGESLGYGYYYYTTNMTDTPESTWTTNDTYGLYCNNMSSGVAFYSQSAGYATLNSTTWDNPIRPGAPTIIFEEVSETEAHIEMGGEFVENTTQTVYEVTADTAFRLYGNYKNYGGDVVESWHSSNNEVASINSETGELDFTGNAGETIITYKVKSGTVAEQQFTFTLIAKTDSEPKRTFKYVTELKNDRPYVIVYKSDITPGGGEVLTTDKITHDALFPDDITVKENLVNDYLYVEIPESKSDKYVWTSGGTDPSFAFITTERSIDYVKKIADINGDGDFGDEGEAEITHDYIDDGSIVGVKNDYLTTEYLGAKITGMGEWGVKGSLYLIEYSNVLGEQNLDLTPYQFMYDSPRLYNKYTTTTEAYYKDGELVYEAYTGLTGVEKHSTYFGISKQKDSQILLFEEIIPDPTAVIKSNYEYIGKNATRDEVCEFQTEQLTAEAQNFPDGDETVVWSSSDTSIATIDQNGKLTYTGKPGKTTITLTITRTNDVDGTVSDTQTANIIVNGGPKEGPDQPEYIENAFYKTDTLIPGRKYVLHMNNNLDNNADVVVSKAVNNQRIGVEGIGAPQIDEINNLEYVLNTDLGNVWECLKSATTGYYYLRNVETGDYMYMSYYNDGDGEVSTVGENRLAGATSSTDNHPGAANFANTQQAYNLIYNNGRLSSQAGDAVRDNNGIALNKSSSNYYYTTFSSSPLTVTLYEEPVVESDEPEIEGDVYYLTDSFVPGNKYIVALSGSAGETTSIKNTGGHSSSGYDYLISDTVTVEDVGADIVIVNPPTTSVWECFASETSGYFYLKDENGNYLVVVCDESTATADADTPQSVTTTDDINAYDAEEYLIKYRTSSSGGGYFGSKASEACSWYLFNNSGNGRHYSMRYSSKYYLYAMEPKSQEIVNSPITQIRKNGRYGSEDVTSTVYNRYNIANGTQEYLLRYVANVNDGYTYKWSIDDTSIATIDEDTGLVTYTGKEGYAIVSLEVTGTDLAGEAYTEKVTTTLRTFNGGYEVDTTTDYPAYPREGSVRTNKVAHNVIGTDNFQYTGVSKVELAVTGVPLQQPVDVVVVFDHSTSMNSGSLLENAMKNTREFALEILDSNPNNRVSIVTFDSIGSRYDYIDKKEITSSLNEDECGVITGNGTIEDAFATREDELELVAQIDSLITNNQGNTNYDYGLKKAYDILKYAKDNGSTNKPIVVFMSDGAPNQFNGMRLDENEDAGFVRAWVSGDETSPKIAPYIADTTTYPAAALFNPNGDNWYSQALKAPAGGDANLPQFDYYSAYQEGLGVKLFTIGYNTTDKFGVLSAMASTPADYYHAEGNLQSTYDSIIQQLLNAANNAVVEDKLGRDFGLQTARSYSVTGYDNDVTLGETPNIVIGAWVLNNSGERVADSFKIYETISFPEGTIESAKSSVLGAGIYNGSEIVGQYVTYDTVTEIFRWNIGDIKRDEVTLTYYVALDGFKEGASIPGAYSTNNYATLEYTNFLGTDCEQTFEVPYLGYKQAVVNYEYYLVNDAGQPVNGNNVVVPFAERVIVGDRQKATINIPSDNSATLNVSASAKAPSGYNLFSNNTAFTITVTSGGVISDATITDGGNPKTTYYVVGSTPSTTVEKSFNNNISFAVKYNAGIINDTKVYDFGLPMEIDVLANDACAPGATITGITATTIAEAELQHEPFAEGDRKNTSSSLELGNGTVKLEDRKIIFTPDPSADMGAASVFYYEAKTTAGSYYYASVKLAPASNVYYEESALDADTTESYVAWEAKGESSASQDKSASTDVYGYDSAYAKTTGFSNGTYYKAVLTADDKSTTDFRESMTKTATSTFKGRGFDLVAACGTNTGIQVVKVKDTSGNILDSFIIDTYFSDETIMTASVEKDANGNAISLLHQVPILSYRTRYVEKDGAKVEEDLPYDTYVVEVNAAYLSMAQALKHTAKAALYNSKVTAVTIDGNQVEKTSATASDKLINELEALGLGDLGDNVEFIWMDDNSVLNGGTGATGIPAAASRNGLLSGYAQQYLTTSVTSLANYIDGFRVYNPLNSGGGDPLYIESEQNASYYNIVEQLEMDADKSNLAYIESDDPSIGLDFIDNGFNFDAYNTQGGPKGEIYLRENDAIAFKFSANHVNSPANVMLGMRAVTGTPTADVTIAGNSDSKQITSSTEMYYQVATQVAVTNEGVTVIVVNTGSGILAVNNIKLVNGNLQDNGTNTPVTGSSPLIGGVSGVPATRPSVVPGATDNAVESDAPDANLPDNSVTDTKTPEADVNNQTGAGDNGEDTVTNTEVPSGVASIFSFIEMLLEFIGSLVKSLGF